MASSDYTQPDSINPRWIAYFAALWVLLIALSEITTLRPLVVAFVWLLVIAALMILLDPSNPSNLLKKVGL